MTSQSWMGPGKPVSKSGFDGHGQARPDDGQDAVQVKPFVRQGHFLDPVTLGAEKTPQPADARMIAGLPGVAHQNVLTQEEDITPLQKRPRALAILGGRSRQRRWHRGILDPGGLGEAPGQHLPVGKDLLASGRVPQG